VVAVQLRLRHPLTPAPVVLDPAPTDRKDSSWT
jgi:hypothetical protein